MSILPSLMSLTDEQRKWLDRALRELLRLFGHATLLDAQVVLVLAENTHPSPNPSLRIDNPLGLLGLTG